MEKHKAKAKRHQRRKKRVRKRIFGELERPRLTVFRSLQHIAAQVIDDEGRRTLVQASSRNKELRDSIGVSGGNCKGATVVGQTLAQRAVAHGIRDVTFDRNGYPYHGRVKALAEAAREAGLRF